MMRISFTFTIDQFIKFTVFSTMNMRGMDIILLYSKNTKEFFDLMYDARTFEHRIVIIGSSKLFFFPTFVAYIWDLHSIIVSSASSNKKINKKKRVPTCM